MTAGAPTPRYAPHRPLPASAFVPGRAPRPARDRRGRSTGAGEERLEHFDPERWRECEPWLFGVDLYNHGYLWEAHESWEGLWLAARVAVDRDDDAAAVLQGLIQCAASALKIAMGEPDGARRLGRLGTEKLARGRAGQRFMGLDLERFARDFRAFLAAEPRSNEHRPRIELGDDAAPGP